MSKKATIAVREQTLPLCAKIASLRDYWYTTTNQYILTRLNLIIFGVIFYSLRFFFLHFFQFQFFFA